MEAGTISFETKTSEFLECSCGNNVSADGFEELPQSCENPHYKCGSCGAFACVDYDFRIVNNIDKAQAVAAGRGF